MVCTTHNSCYLKTYKIIKLIPIAPAASDFPFRLLVDAVTHVFSVFRVCKVP